MALNREDRFVLIANQVYREASSNVGCDVAWILQSIPQDCQDIARAAIDWLLMRGWLVAEVDQRYGWEVLLYRA